MRAIAVPLLLAAVSCGGRGGAPEASSSGREWGKELAPPGAQVAEVTSLEGDRVTSEVHIAAAGGAPGAVAPLVAYKELCGDLPFGDFGLDHPRLRVRMRHGRDDDVTLTFGDRNFNGGGVYTSRHGWPCIYLITTQTVRDLARLAGPAAAAVYGPADGAAPDVSGASEAEQVHPWVAQARRHAGGD